MATVKENVEALNQMILQGEMLDAFDKFYAEDVVIQENVNEPVSGKSANRTNEVAFLDGITAFRGAEVKNIIINDQVTVIQWHFDYDHKDWGTRKYDQVSVQRWDGDQIVYEKFYYSN
jgi:SnoaL-like protein